MKSTKPTIDRNMYVITLSGENYYIFRQEQFITLSSESYYIFRQEQFITLSANITLFSGSKFISLSGERKYYIIR